MVIYSMLNDMEVAEFMQMLRSHPLNLQILALALISSRPTIILIQLIILLVHGCKVAFAP
jgi:hypothetical protein